MSPARSRQFGEGLEIGDLGFDRRPVGVGQHLDVGIVGPFLRRALERFELFAELVFEARRRRMRGQFRRTVDPPASRAIVQRPRSLLPPMRVARASQAVVAAVGPRPSGVRVERVDLRCGDKRAIAEQRMAAA
jgi:hypothetical protein